MNKDFIVFSKRLAKVLVNQGFVLKEKQVNKFRPEYYVYVFEDKDGIESAIAKTTKKNLQTFSAE